MICFSVIFHLTGGYIKCVHLTDTSSRHPPSCLDMDALSFTFLLKDYKTKTVFPKYKRCDRVDMAKCSNLGNLLWSNNGIFPSVAHCFMASRFQLWRQLFRLQKSSAGFLLQIQGFTKPHIHTRHILRYRAHFSPSCKKSVFLKIT